VSLGEGGTPLLQAPRLSEKLGLELWLKWEGQNPTGSFKDRGMTVAISKALEEGATEGVVVASTGNTAASAAAYAARAGMRALILHPAGAVAAGKLAQAVAVGGEVRAVEGDFPAALAEARELAARPGWTLLNSGGNEYRLQGQKTAAFEILEDLGRAPDVLALPYGGGGNTRAYALGFEEAGAAPKLLAGAAADRAGTAASAIRITVPAHLAKAEERIRASGGSVVELSDEEILAMRHELAVTEGVFCEPASAAGIAAAARERPSGTIVCVITGHGLKDVH
jgi:threonine synthase